MPNKPGPAYRESPWPLLRNALVSYLDSSRPHLVQGVVEMDVTEALEAIWRIQHELQLAVSFHAFLVHSLVQAAMHHPAVVTYRRGNKLLTFEDIDVLNPIEKRLANGLRIPIAYILRAAQQKTLADINWELRGAIRADDLPQEESVCLRRRFGRMPAPGRKFLSWRTKKDPFLLKKLYGTTLLTNVRMHGFVNGGAAWGPTVHTFSMGAGTVTDRLRLNERGEVVKRKVLTLSASADHDIIDGMVAARFIAQMTQLVESAAGLDEEFVEETRGFIGETHGRAREAVHA